MTFKAVRPARNELDHERLWTAVILSGALLFKITPQGFFAAFPCLFKTVTGLPCPTCFITRTALCLVDGNIASAFRLSPAFTALFCAAALYAAYGLVACLFRTRRLRLAFESRAGLRIFLAGLASPFLVNWILNMLGRA
jgi:hypothetical protein